MRGESVYIVQAQMKSGFEFLSLKMDPCTVGGGIWVREQFLATWQTHILSLPQIVGISCFVSFYSQTIYSAAYFFWESKFCLCHRLRESLIAYWQALKMMELELWQVTHAYGCLLWLYIAVYLGLFMVALSWRSMSSKQGPQSHRKSFYSLCDQLWNL